MQDGPICQQHIGIGRRSYVLIPKVLSSLLGDKTEYDLEWFHTDTEQTKIRDEFATYKYDLVMDISSADTIPIVCLDAIEGDIVYN